MPRHPPPDGPDLAGLARQLAAERDSITVEWMNAVKEDVSIPSADKLTLKALEDHFPEMLDELISALAQPTENIDSRPTKKTGAQHGKARWRSGYRLDEVLRELARMREIITAHAETFSNLDGPARNSAKGRIHRFFDTIAATSAREYIQEQDAEVVLRSRQLQHAYEQVQAATEQLRDVSQSRLRLLRTVSHELRNFLNAVNLVAHSLLEESNPRHREELGVSLTRSVAHLQALLDRLHDFSEILAGESRAELADVNLAEFLRDLEAKYRPVAERKGLRFESHYSIDHPMVRSDGAKLREIAGSLLSNAINFTSNGIIQVCVIGIDPDRWMLRVEDTGGGIAPADARHIFSEFHYGVDARQRQGIGLGLAITRHLVHLLEGEITFSSEIEKGTTFEVNLPRFAPSDAE